MDFVGNQNFFHNLIPLFKQSWSVLVLFLVPIGGGIPAGVILGDKLGVSWPHMGFLYMISDMVLACVFEPLMLGFIRLSHNSPFMQKVRSAFAQSRDQMVKRFGLHPTPFALILITFGTDPMTGRSVAKAVGHGFLSGWALVIAGDMLFFFVVMASTLWLNNILGDGTVTAIIITLLILFIPGLIRKIRRQEK